MVFAALLGAALSSSDPIVVVDLRGPSIGVGLNRLARQADRALVAHPDDLARPRRGAIKGRMRLSQALAAWCAPVRLSCRLVAGGIVVKPAPMQRRAPATLPRLATPAPADIIVTGRGDGMTRGELERSYSASHIAGPELARQHPAALADLLATMPGVWADRSAGTAANTVRVRGIPLDGYQAVAIEEDSLPVQHDTLPWTDVDQFVRPDLALESVDYVRGGPSAIFASNAPGGILNLRTRSAGDRFAGGARATTDERGLARIEAYAGGPVGDGWRLLGSGMVVRDPSVRRIAATLGGWQARLHAAHDIGARGRLMIGIRLLDDDTLNVSSFPMSAERGRLTALPGFDPRRDSWFGPGLASVRFAAAGTRPLSRNNRNRLAAGTGTLTLPLGDGTLTVRARHRRSITRRYAVSSSGPPVTARDAIVNALPLLTRAFPTNVSAALRHVDDAAVVGNETWVETLNPVAADTRLRETIAEMRYALHLDLAGRHDVTLGSYATRYHWDFRRAVARVLAEARGGAPLLDLVGRDERGAATGLLTDAGFLSRGSTFEHVAADQRMTALYLSDEWALAPRWRVDWGVRHERGALDGRIERAAIVDGGDRTTLADDALAMPSGDRLPRRLEPSGIAATLALQWQAGTRVSLFTRATRAVRLPDPGVFRLGGDGESRTLRVEQGELGLLWRGRGVSLDATLFASRFAQIALEDMSIDPSTGGILVRNHDATARTLGVEVSGRVTPTPGIAIRGSATVQDPRLANYRLATLVNGMPGMLDLGGRMPRRVPQLMAQASVTAALPGTPLTLDADVAAMGRRFADDANRLALPGFASVDMGASWALRPDASLRVRVTNLFDVIAVMQGDAIGGEVQAGAAPVVVVRAQQGRIVEAGVTVSF